MEIYYLFILFHRIPTLSTETIFFLQFNSTTLADNQTIRLLILVASTFVLDFAFTIVTPLSNSCLTLSRRSTLFSFLPKFIVADIIEKRRDKDYRYSLFPPFPIPSANLPGRSGESMRRLGRIRQ